MITYHNHNHIHIHTYLSHTHGHTHIHPMLTHTASSRTCPPTSYLTPLQQSSNIQPVAVILRAPTIRTSIWGPVKFICVWSLIIAVRNRGIAALAVLITHVLRSSLLWTRQFSVAQRFSRNVRNSFFIPSVIHSIGTDSVRLSVEERT